MAEDSLKELGPGQIGEASYNHNVQQWSFSQAVTNDELLRTVTPFRQCIPPIDRYQVESDYAQTKGQMKWLAQSYPQFVSAHSLIFRTLSASAAPSNEAPDGNLLAIGCASIDAKFRPGRSLPVFASASGPSGNVLRILLPRIDWHGWKGASLGLSLLNPCNSETSDWSGSDGSISQIVFAEDEAGPGNWLAVRQTYAVNVLRPTYFRKPNASAAHVPGQRLHLNHIISLKNEASASYVDVAFNPWYHRQFVVINEFGQWSTWNIEGRKQQCHTIVHGKSGQFKSPDAVVKEAAQLAGWFRIFWAHDINTLIISSRMHLEVVSISSTTARFECPKLITNSEQVIDITLDPANHSRFYVLTRSRLSWLQLCFPGLGENEANIHTVEVLLSFRHYRNAGNNLKLTTSRLKDASMVWIYSDGTPLLDAYIFYIDIDSGQPTGARSSLSTVDVDHCMRSGLPSSLTTMCTTPVAFLRRHFQPIPGQDPDYESLGISFHQVWAFTRDCGLHASLLALKPVKTLSRDLVRKQISAPTRSRRMIRLLALRVPSEDDFIDPDGEDLDILSERRVFSHRRKFRTPRRSDHSKLTIDWRAVFEQAFETHVDVGTQSQEPTSMREILRQVESTLKDGLFHESLSLTTLYEICRKTNISDDLELASQLMQDYLGAIQPRCRSDLEVALTVSDITSHPPTRLLTSAPMASSTLTSVYDQLAETWLSSLPIALSGQARLAKHRAVRKIALDIFLNSKAISLYNISSLAVEWADLDDEPHIHQTSKPRAFIETPMDDSPAIDSASPSILSTQPEEAHHTLPKSRRTPSLRSLTPSASTRDIAILEDSVVTRLKQYVPSVKVLGNIDSRTSQLLSTWPSTPGTNPVSYAWVPLPTYEGHGGETRSEKRSSESQSRRYSQSSSFVDLNRSASSESVPRFRSSPFKGQPSGMSDTLFSSPAANDLPTTQVDRGRHGSKAVMGKAARRKRRRAAGF